MAAAVIRLRRSTGGRDCWTVPCRDEDGRKACLRVHLRAHGVVLSSTAGGPVTLDPLDVGRLRSALRAAVLARADLLGEDGVRP